MVMLPPFVGPELDLRDFRWMKLDIIALLNSDFNATVDDTAWRAGVTLWCRAWHQVPAGSLPKEDAMLCSLAGLGRDQKTWRRIKPTALRGFEECTDGRLYHPFLCVMASNAMKERHRYEDRKERDRARKQNGSGDENPPDIPPISAGIPPGNAKNSSGKFSLSSGIPRRNAVEGEGEGEREEKEKKEAGRSLRSLGQIEPVALPGFDEFWTAYPRKVAKDAARRAYASALRREPDFALILRGLQRQHWRERQFTPHPATWLNQGRWTDDPEAVTPTAPAAATKQSNLMMLINGGAAEMLRRAQERDSEDAQRSRAHH